MVGIKTYREYNKENVDRLGSHLLWCPGIGIFCVIINKMRSLNGQYHEIQF